MKHFEDAAKVHGLVDAEIQVYDKSLMGRKAKMPSLLATLLSYDSSVVEVALGDTGVRLRNFAASTSGCNHPDLFEIKDGILSDGHEFSVVAQEIVKLAALATEAQLSIVLPHIRKIITKISGYVPMIKDLDSSHSNHARFISSPEGRDVARRNKKVQTINLNSIVQRNPEQWIPAGDSYASLARNQTPFQTDIEQNLRRASLFSEIGAASLASRLHTSALEFKQYSKDRYYGFNRLSVTLASIIAAKIMQCDLSNTMRSCRIIYPQEVAQDILKAIGNSTLLVKSAGAVLYEPRLYPVHDMIDLMPDRTKKLLGLIEAFPEVGHCSLFDHYWCLIPSFFVLNIPSTYANGGNDIGEMAVKFDKAVLKANATPAILMGEKDGKSYFIDYWS